MAPWGYQLSSWNQFFRVVFNDQSVLLCSFCLSALSSDNQTRPAHFTYHCFFPFLFFLLLLLLLPFALLPLPGEVGSPCAPNMPELTAFWNHSKNSSSFSPPSMFVPLGTLPPLCAEVLPLPLLCFAMLALT